MNILKRIRNADTPATSRAGSGQFSPAALRHRALAGLTASLLTFGAGAADTEIYTNQRISAGKPNLLFIIDTSFSMTTEIEITENYDPNHDYVVPPGSPACDADYTYYRLPRPGFPIPACDSTQRFLTSSSRCTNAQAPLQDVGFYTDKISRYQQDQSRWLILPLLNPAAVPEPDHVECRGDQPSPYTGDPGDYLGADDSGSTARFITGGSAPYGTQYSDFDWSSSTLAFTYTLYNANYLNWYYYHNTLQMVERLAVVKRTLKDILNQSTGIRVGLMRFNIDSPQTPVHENDGGRVLFAISDIDDIYTDGDGNTQTVREAMSEAVDSMEGKGATPLAETLSEAYRYWVGEAPEYGAGSGESASVATSKNSNGDYISPFQTNCSANYQIVLSDGIPDHDQAADPYINSILSRNLGDDDNEALILGSSCAHRSMPIESCMDNLAEYMNKVDLTIGDTPDIDQTVSTFTVGFNLESDPEATELLGRAAEHGGGQFYLANDTQGLVSVFSEIIARIFDQNASFSSPAVSVNALNRLVHNDELYFALFDPVDRGHWPGNIKRYRLLPNPDDADDFIIVDRNDQSAVDPDTAQIRDTATSWWRHGSTPDGNTVAAGGMAERLFDFNTGSGNFDADSRIQKVFTFVDDYSFNDFENFPAAGKDLVPLDAGNTGITHQILDLPASTPPEEIRDLINWGRGVDVFDRDADGDTTEGRPSMGAPLHARPVVVTYGTDLNANAQTNVIFSMTNDGYFHISRTEEPADNARLEHTAFIPRSLLKNLKPLAENAKGEPIYGLDGSITIWREDVGNDGTINSADGDHVYAYFGQRRGGRGVYALNVTDPDDPKLLWFIDPDSPEQGNADADTDRTAFARMGQTWAAPQHTRMRVDADQDGILEEQEIRDVIVLSGGYYPSNQDHQGDDRDRGENDQGNAIFIVDAQTGELYWWVGKTNTNDPQGLKLENDDTVKMKYGFTGEVNAVDFSGDGAADVMIAADNGGQIWRFDIDNQPPSSASTSLKDRITGGVIADIQRSSPASVLTAENNRRFYYSVDIALVSLDTAAPYFTIAIGSGFRAHPLDKAVEDRFYLIKDYDMAGPPRDSDGDIDYETLYEDDLLDVTELNFADDSTSIDVSDQEKLNTAGWYIRLGAGEKVLARSITIAGNVIFTSYTPPDETFDPDSCTISTGTGAAYVVRIDDARPVFDLDQVGQTEDSNLTIEDRRQNLKAAGIPAEPLPVYTEGPNGNEAVILVGREDLHVDISARPQTSYWYQDF